MLNELKATILFFTWFTNNGGRPIRSMIDRALGNESWFQTFPCPEAKFLSHSILDHTPILLTHGIDIVSWPKLLKFFNYWVKFPGFLEVVENSWSEEVEHSVMFRLAQKFQRLKFTLNDWSKSQQ